MYGRGFFWCINNPPTNELGMTKDDEPAVIGGPATVCRRGGVSQRKNVSARAFERVWMTRPVIAAALFSNPDRFPPAFAATQMNHPHLGKHESKTLYLGAANASHLRAVLGIAISPSRRL